MAPKRKAANAKKEVEEPAPKVAEPATKRKAEEAKEEPPKKEAKKEEEDAKKEAADEAMAQEGAEKELDDKPDKRPPLKDAITFEPTDMTLNVVPTLGGKMLTALSDGGMHSLVAGARANVGVKSGRYLFEVRVVEVIPTGDVGGRKGGGKAPLPRQVVRIGFSVLRSSLFLGDSDDSISFDADGFFTSMRKRTAVSQRFARDQVIGVLLNLDPKSRNADTVSLFVEGVRFSEPQPLPDCLKGKLLCPHICFRNVSLQMHFGPQPLKALPFKCTSLQNAAQADIKVTPSTASKDGKYEVILPVAFPDEGTFDWLDMFLEENKKYVELSDRKILEWAQKSGLWRGQAGGANWTQTTSNDKPSFNYGVPGLDDFSIRKIINTVASVVPRNYIVMEVKGNLLEDERRGALKKFSASCYKKVAHVVMGAPSGEWTEHVQEQLLKAKQEQADAVWNKARLEKERLKKLEADKQQYRQNRLDEVKARLAKNAVVTDKSKKEEENAEKKDAEMGGEDEKEEKAKAEEEEEQTEPPKVELTAEEKKTVFHPKQLKDLTDQILNQSFDKFSIPTKDEGFDEVKFEWDNAKDSSSYLKKWVIDRKLYGRIEDLKPSRWFVEKLAAWQKSFADWQSKQKAFKLSKNNTKAKTAENAGEEDDKESDGVDDIFSIVDVSDVGNGVPLFDKFGFEDWTLLQLRQELDILVKAFKKDVDDPDRPGIHESNLGFYYQKYFAKQLNCAVFGVGSIKDLVELVKDVVDLDSRQILISKVEEDSEDVGSFLKLTEECRRTRQRRIDAGDETARLKFDTRRPWGGPGQPPQTVSQNSTLGIPMIMPSQAPRPAFVPVGPQGKGANMMQEMVRPTSAKTWAQQQQLLQNPMAAPRT